MPHLLVVGGPNGAGKTTLAQEYVREYPGYTYLGADAIAAELQPEAPEKIAVQTARLFLERLDAHVGARRDLVIESTLGRADKWKRESESEVRTPPSRRLRRAMP